MTVTPLSCDILSCDDPLERGLPMTVEITIRLPDSTAKRLDEMARTSHLSKTDLIIQAVESILASQLDRKITSMSDKQFEEASDFLKQPAPTDVQEKLAKTMNTPLPWSRK